MRQIFTSQRLETVEIDVNGLKLKHRIRLVTVTVAGQLAGK